ncbi:MAG: DUF4834 family protein [Prevotella sp.]|jgi:hypothetical protein|nr:DUF4834 family protein [Prevotella sp.]MDR3060314.1 DUF4834 family protein [Prevotella sp.]
MTFIFFLIFAIVIFGIMLILTLVRGISSFIFGKPSSSFSGSGYQTTSGFSGGREKSQHNGTAKTHHKVFSKDEGEYVKYEEIKE